MAKRLKQKIHFYCMSKPGTKKEKRRNKRCKKVVKDTCINVAHIIWMYRRLKINVLSQHHNNLILVLMFLWETG